MSSEADRAELVSALLSRPWNVFERALAQAAEHPDGDRLLAEATTDLRGDRLLCVAATLGDLRGPAGDQVLRGLLDLSGPGTQDTRCAALLALVKRHGANASSELADALKSRNVAVRDDAVLGLAAFGDDRAWDDVLRHLTRRLRVQDRNDSHPPEAVVAVIYLLAHVESRPDRLHALVRVLRDNWTHLTSDEDEWLTRHWREAAPDGPPADTLSPPDGETLRRQFAMDPLFAPLGPHEPPQP